MSNFVGQGFGDYRLTRYLGGGGFADVYLGEHTHLKKKTAAIKLLKGAFTQEKIKIFREEAQKIEDLRHPHIVSLTTFSTQVIKVDGAEREIPFLVMEYAPGGSLVERHPRGSKLPLEVILSYVKPIAAALQYAHDQKVIHRDVKPANFLLGKDEKVLLSDFGIAVIAHATESMPIQDIIGTPVYMAPEQFDGKPVRASDQYALGVVVYEWLCGEPPFGGPSFGLYAHQHKEVPPTSLRKMGVDISSAIDQVILKALEKEPRQRFARVQDFADALEQATQEDEKEIVARFISEAEYTPDWLGSDHVQRVLLHQISAKEGWWEKDVRPKIDALRVKGEKEANSTITTVLSALAKRAAGEAIAVIEQKNYSAFGNLLNVMRSATPPSQHPTVWITLFEKLESQKAHAFVVQHEPTHAELLRLLSFILPNLKSERIQPWLPGSWLEFGTFLSLRLPDEWNRVALRALLTTDTVGPIPPEVVQRIEQNDEGLVDDLFRQLLEAPQERSAAIRLFTQLVASGYTKKMHLLHLLLTSEISEQQMQQVVEFMLASAHFTAEEGREFFETYGERYIPRFLQSTILLDRIRRYLQTVNANELGQVSPTKNFLRILRNNSQQFPPDIQETVQRWREISDFIDQPSIEQTKLHTLATAIVPFLQLEIRLQLIEKLAQVCASCAEDEFDLIRVIHVMSPVLTSETLNFLYGMAEVAGKAAAQQHSGASLLPYIRLALQIEKVYDIPPGSQERFIPKFIDILLKDISPEALRKLCTRITEQSWSARAFTTWNTYLSNRQHGPENQNLWSTINNTVTPMNDFFGKWRILVWICFMVLSAILGVWAGEVVRNFTYYSYYEGYVQPGYPFFWFDVVGIGAALVGLALLLARGRAIVDILGGIAFTLLGDILLVYRAYLFAQSSYFHEAKYALLFQCTNISTLFLLLLGTRFLVRSANVRIGPVVGALIIIAGIAMPIYSHRFTVFELSISIVQILLGIVVIIVPLWKAAERQNQSLWSTINDFFGKWRILAWICFMVLSALLGIWGSQIVHYYMNIEQDYNFGYSFAVLGVGSVLTGLAFVLARGRAIVDILGGIAFILLGDLLLWYSAYVFYEGVLPFNLNSGNYPAPSSGTLLFMLVCTSIAALLLLLLGMRFFVRSANAILGSVIGILMIIAGIVLLMISHPFVQYNYAILPDVVSWLWVLQILLGIVVIIVTLLKGRRNKSKQRQNQSLWSTINDFLVKRRILAWLCFIALNLIIGLWAGLLLLSEGGTTHGAWLGLAGGGAAIVGLIFLLTKGQPLVDILGGIALTLFGNLALLTFLSPTVAECGFQNASDYSCYPFPIPSLSYAVLILSISILLLLLGTRFFLREGNTAGGLIFGAGLILAGIVVAEIIQTSATYTGGVSTAIPEIGAVVWFPSVILGVTVMSVSFLKRQQNKKS